MKLIIFDGNCVDIIMGRDVCWRRMGECFSTVY